MTSGRSRNQVRLLAWRRFVASCAALGICCAAASGCGESENSTSTGSIGHRVLPTFLVGEALVGEGNDVAHIAVLIGEKTGPAGSAFANSFASQHTGHPVLLAVLAPNMAAMPSTLMVPEVPISEVRQSVQLFGPLQYGVAKAVTDSVSDGVIPKEKCDELVIVCRVFVHWEAADDQKLFQHNYEAVKLALKRAFENKPTTAEVLDFKRPAKSPVP